MSLWICEQCDGISGPKLFNLCPVHGTKMHRVQRMKVVPQDEIDAIHQNLVDSINADILSATYSTYGCAPNEPRALTAETVKSIIDDFKSRKIVVQGKEIELFGYDIHESKDTKIAIKRERFKDDGQPHMLIFYPDGKALVCQNDPLKMEFTI